MPLPGTMGSLEITMLHPFESISSARRRQFFYPLLGLALLIMMVMNWVGLPLNTPAAPNGIVSFELAGSPERAAAMLNSWDADAHARAAFIQGLDFLFPAVYSTTVALGCIMAASALSARRLPLAHWGRALAWGQWIAAIFDYLENIALVVLLFSPAQAPWPQMAAVCAVIKFGLLFAGLVYGFYGLVMRWGH